MVKKGIHAHFKVVIVPLHKIGQKFDILKKSTKIYKKLNVKHANKNLREMYVY